MTLSAGVDPSDQAQAGVGTLTLSPTLATGNYSVTFTYSGDGNYNGCCSPAATTTITVVANSGLPSTTSASFAGVISPNSTITVTGTVTGSGTTAPTGGVIFFSSGDGLGEVAVTPGAGDVSTFTAVLSSQDLVQGANFIILQYTGDTHYAPSEFTLNGGSSIPNPLSDFTLVPDTTIVPVSISAGQNSGTDTINVSSVNSFNGAVNLTCAATAPLTCTISPNPSVSAGNPSTATLTIKVPAGTANGNYNVLVTGKDATGEFIHTLAITADVSGEVSTPTFALSNSGNITVVPGAATGNTSTISVSPTNGFTGTVDLSCAVTTSPNGATSPVTCSIPSSVDITGTTALTAILTATSTATTTPGAYAITVTGTASGITPAPTTVVTVTVSAAAASAYTVSATSPPSGISPGSNATSTITAQGSGGYTGSVTLSCSLTSSPSGASDLPGCSITTGSPVALSAGTTSGQATATVTTTAASSSNLAYPKVGNGKGWLGAGSGAVLAVLIFFGIPARRRSWRSLLGIVVAMLVLGGLSSCGGSSGGGGGGGGGGNPGTTAGPYTFTVTSSGNPAVTPAPATTFTVSVN
jgi:hypothetical protein